ncbi:MAG: archaea-specific SMC-related protein [Halobacteriales archaeon]
MAQQLDRPDDPEAAACEVTVEHVGGIDACHVEFTPGVTLLTGRNATNRTSLLRALGGVLGGDAATLKSDADAGRVELTVGDETYTRVYERAGTGVTAGGEPYTDRDDLVDLFVAVLASNEARRAVERGADLREVIMRPVDTAAIERRIAELREEREAVRAELQESRSRREELPALEARRGELEAELADLEEELDRLQAAVAEADASVDDEGPADDLEAAREERQELADRVEVLEAELEALQGDRDELRAELDDLPEASPAEREELERELRSVRERKRGLDDQVASLTAVLEFNEDVLGGDALPRAVAPEEGTPADELDPDAGRELVCWTCGSPVRRADIADRLDELRAVVDEKRQASAEFAGRVSELEEELTHVERVIERREELADELEAAEAKIAEREEELAALEDRAARLDDRVASLEAELAAAEGDDEGELREAYRAISECRYERHRLRRELADVEDDIADIEATPEPAELRDRLETLEADLERERHRVDELEANAVDAFNEHMADLLGVLGYANLERVWIERKPGGDADVADSVFDLHVVRESADGAAYEDVVAHLSESEREVVGLVVALAGYLAHDVAEEVPFMLLDSLEAVDAGRIEALVGYFARHVPYLVVALLPEDARSLPDRYDRVTGDAIGG